MPKLNELLEQRAELVSAMRTADEANDQTAFDKAEGEVRALDQQIARARKVQDAERSEQATVISGGGDDRLSAELRSFSIARMIAHQIDPSIDAGREIELQAELAKRAGRVAKGFYAPLECFALEERAAQTTATSGSIIPTDFRPDLFVSALTAGTALQAMGATVLTGLTGNVEIPRETGSPAVGWVAENTALPTGNASFDSLTLTPHHVGAITELSRQLIMQASPAAEGLIRQMLSRNIALEIDRAAINGSGTGAEPRGLLNDPDVASVPYDADLFNTTADMIAAADLANVDARRAFLSTNGVKATALKVRDGDGHAVTIAETFHGEPTFFTNQAPSNLGTGEDEHALAYGDWRDFLVGVWSQLDILVNPYAETAYSKGNVLIRAMATVDFGVRRPASFVIASGVPGPA
ncbi:major capsid protein [Altererythrobacter sp. B11]|uniref:phage major capsid protein n=1 Tax=Altererythrobacter sp. B11 TaxID=2060312 RepID=UPI000DC71573|nr:phage major capsid protein [Altererythrobacter sp. B11]BBC74406.1 major capsid protein [Altererythrobacter sp. B11]